MADLHDVDELSGTRAYVLKRMAALMSRTIVVDQAEIEQELKSMLAKMGSDQNVQLFAVGIDKDGGATVYQTGKIYGLGIAATILQAEFAKEWASNG